MSVTYAAYTIVGSRVEIKDFYNEISESVHKDCLETGTGKYCSSCGRPAAEVTTRRVAKDGFQDSRGMEEDEVNGLRMKGINNAHDELEYFVLVDFHKVGGYSDNNRACRMEVDIEECRQKVKAALDPLGLWDPTQFGIWTAQYCSP